MRLAGNALSQIHFFPLCHSCRAALPILVLAMHCRMPKRAEPRLSHAKRLRTQELPGTLRASSECSDYNRFRHSISIVGPRPRAPQWFYFPFAPMHRCTHDCNNMCTVVLFSSAHRCLPGSPRCRLNGAVTQCSEPEKSRVNGRCTGITSNPCASSFAAIRVCLASMRTVHGLICSTFMAIQSDPWRKKEVSIGTRSSFEIPMNESVLMLYPCAPKYSSICSSVNLSALNIIFVRDNGSTVVSMWVPP